MLAPRFSKKLGSPALDGVVEDLDAVELAVHDGVEQAVQEGAGAEPEQVAVVLPPPDHLLHVEAVVLADGHEAPLKTRPLIRLIRRRLEPSAAVPADILVA